MSYDNSEINSDTNSDENSSSHSYDTEQLRRIIEGAILAAGEALSVDKLHSLFEEYEAPEKSIIKEVLEAIAADCEGRGFQLVEVASGWRFQIREDVATWVNRLWEEKPQKYSRAMLETLALIAYRQPLTRGDIEDVRGVAVSSHIIRTLVEREWVKVVGHRDVPGRPSLYATTRHFLDYFNLKSLDELPTLSELKDIDSINGSLDWGDDKAPEPAADVLEDTADTAVSETDDDTDTATSDYQSELENKEQSTREDYSVVQDTSTELDQAEDDISGDSDAEFADESLSADSSADDGDDLVSVQSVEIPAQFDQDASLPTDATMVADAVRTVEQEEFAQARREREQAGKESTEQGDDDDERDYSDDSLFAQHHSTADSADEVSPQTDSDDSPDSSDKQ